jgi:death-on-curing protein
MFLHKRSLERHGGQDGVRDRSGLQAAIHQPQSLHHYTGCDLFEIAAAYAFHIAQAQACFDGNKRTAAAACYLFLRRNGVKRKAKMAGLVYDALIAIAERRMSREELAARLRELHAEGTRG